MAAISCRKTVSHTPTLTKSAKQLQQETSFEDVVSLKNVRNIFSVAPCLHVLNCSCMFHSYIMKNSIELGHLGSCKLVD